MVAIFRRLRTIKRQIVILGLLAVGTLWFHHTTSIQIIGNVYRTGKVQARLGIVYEWMKANPSMDDDHHHAIEGDHAAIPPEHSIKSIDTSSSSESLTTGLWSSAADRSINNMTSSHPFENSCQYPILNPEDDSLHHVIKHMRIHVCKRVQPDLLTFDYDRGELIFDRELARREFGGDHQRIHCAYRPFSGGIRPRITDYTPLGDWREMREDRVTMTDDLIEAKCFLSLANISTTTTTTPKPKSTASTFSPRGFVPARKANPKWARNLPPTSPTEKEVFRFAFGHIVRRNATAGKSPKEYVANDESTLSIDFLFLDSTSHNSMRRHMPRTWKYMKETMGFYHLEGYTKVGDNSMVNLMPILAGLRYGDQAPDMPTEVEISRAIEVEPLPFLWKNFRERGCATLFNDDIADYTRGFLNYPWTHVKGFAEIPTDHFARPWHIFHRRYPIEGSSKFCFGNQPYVKLQMQFLEQMIKKYRDTCHFSFNFITDLPHDDPNNLELADEDTFEMLKRLYTGNYLNNTILFVMGDHGNRIGYIMYTYVGRIEERMTHFSVYIPEWYRKKHPEAMRRLELNRHRLTSNYDVHRMIKEIFNDTLSDPIEPPINDPTKAVAKGISLFRSIPSERTCDDANIPPPHCVCLEDVPAWAATANLTTTHAIYQMADELVRNWTRSQLEEHPAACRQLDSTRIVSIRATTTSQMIQHGVRDLTKDQTKKLARRIDGDLEYMDVIYTIEPGRSEARTRLQYFKKPKKRMIVNVEPFPFVSNGTSRSNIARKQCDGQSVPWYCQCVK